jgi:hypothetical protein
MSVTSLKLLNINRKITIVIAFLLAVSSTALALIGNIASATIDYSYIAAEGQFKYLLQLQVLKDIVERR